MKWCNNELIAELTNNEISYDDKYKIFVDEILFKNFIFPRYRSSRWTFR